MQHVLLADLPKIGGMFLERENLCYLTLPNVQHHHIDGWEMLNYPQLQALLSPVPNTPPTIPPPHQQ